MSKFERQKYPYKDIERRQVGEDTSEASHTPGPWEVKEDTISKAVWITNDAVSGDICDLYFRSNEECIKYPNAKANAHLIASAPELLEALKECLVLIEGEWTGFNDKDLTPDGTIGMVGKLIDKAEGRG